MSLLILLSAFLIQVNMQPTSPPRSILLFGRQASPLIKEQWQLLQKDSTGLAERDIEVKIIEPGNALYTTYGIAVKDRFTIILVGRDGGEKYRSHHVTKSAHFFALIDAMPMRRSEMRKNKKAQP